jgi:hypothetical protein
MEGQRPEVMKQLVEENPDVADFQDMVLDPNGTEFAELMNRCFVPLYAGMRAAILFAAQPIFAVYCGFSSGPGSYRSVLLGLALPDSKMDKDVLEDRVSALHSLITRKVAHTAISRIAKIMEEHVSCRKKVTADMDIIDAALCLGFDLVRTNEILEWSSNFVFKHLVEYRLDGFLYLLAILLVDNRHGPRLLRHTGDQTRLERGLPMIHAVPRSRSRMPHTELLPCTQDISNHMGVIFESGPCKSTCSLTPVNQPAVLLQVICLRATSQPD